MLVKFIKNKIIDYNERSLTTALHRNIVQEVERASVLGQKNFPAEIILPQNYGKGLPERVVELLLLKLSYSPNIRVLDVGHANAMDCHLKVLQSLPRPSYITGIDIANPVYDSHLYYKQSMIGDITKTPFSDGEFELIWCISALEHFGMDNSVYTENFERENTMDIQAIHEMLRLLTTGGKLLITVPYGKYEDHGWFKNYDKEHWQRLINIVQSKAKVQEWYFRHTFGKGWSSVHPDELQYIGYYDQANSGAAGLAAVYITKR